MRRRVKWIDRMQAVCREYETAAVALDLLAELLRQDPSALERYGLRHTDDWKNEVVFP